MEKISKGTVITFSRGSYSDYEILAVMVATEDITQEDYHEAIKEESKKNRYRQSEHVVISNLVRSGKLVDVNSVEFYLGDCGTLPLHMDLI